MTCKLVSDLKVSDLISVPACGPKVLLSAQAEDRTSLGPYGHRPVQIFYQETFNLWVFLHCLIFWRNTHGRLNASWKICSLAVNGQSFLVIDGYLLNP